MSWRLRLFYLMGAMATLPCVILADPPTLQLTVQPARLPNHDNFAANTLLRELQRQAVLIAARDELGLATRDMVLRETFAPHGSPGVTTVLCSTRVEKNQAAQLFLSRFDGTQPTDGFALADLPVDQPQNSCRQTVSFPLSKDPLVDYPEFITRCEEASRTSYLKALQTENVLGDFAPQPTRWDADKAAPADPVALRRLQHLDVFSQYLALRLLHAQIRTDGASSARLTALVRGYANLGQLTRNQWSQANKAFSARALLYAQRLVVHENSSSISLYTRAYSRAFVGLHAAALQDLADAAKQPDAAPAAWVDLVRALCLHDATLVEASLANGSWRYRPLATFLSAKILTDDFPTARQTQSRTRALADYPSLFGLNGLSNIDQPEPTAGVGGDEIISQLPTVLVNALDGAQLPAPAQSQVRLVAPGPDTFSQLARLRDRLIDAALKAPRDTQEPSYAVLADLIEQQEFVGIAHRAIAGATFQQDVKNLVNVAAYPILKVHLWHPFVNALVLDNPSEGEALNQTLAKIKDHDPGPWLADAINDSYRIPNESNKFVKGWIEAANLSADTLVNDYTAANFAAKFPRRTLQQSLQQLQQTAPHSAKLLQAWMSAYPIASLQKNPRVYQDTLKTVEQEFSDRPAVAMAASDWCNAIADFPRSLKLMQQVDRLEPSAHLCDQLALVERRLGKHSTAIDDLIRGIKLSDDPSEKATMYQRAAYFFIEDHQYNDALTCVQLSGEAPTTRVWQIMARCYELMGRLDDADECLNQLAILDPTTLAQHCLWARRLHRANARDIQQQAMAVFAQPGENFYANFFVLMADHQEPKALDLLRKNRDQMQDAYQFANLIILAKKQNNRQVVTNNLSALRNRAGDHQSFGVAFRTLVQSKNLADGIIAFDSWVDRQLDDEDAVDWYSLAGRYLLAAGHASEGKVYLTHAVQSTVHEREDYYLAWQELTNLDANPTLAP